MKYPCPTCSYPLVKRGGGWYCDSCGKDWEPAEPEEINET